MSMKKIADYAAVQQKGARIFRNGGVEPVAITPTYSQCLVHSETGGTYLNLISFASGDESKIEDWTCECPWATYQIGGRDTKYKHLEGRKCAHTLAHLYFLMSFKQTNYNTGDI